MHQNDLKIIKKYLFETKKNKKILNFFTNNFERKTNSIPLIS